MSKVDMFLLPNVKMLLVHTGKLVVPWMLLDLVGEIGKDMFLDSLADLQQFVVDPAAVELMVDQVLQELPLIGFDK
jgi:hypothetical protein